MPDGLDNNLRNWAELSTESEWSGLLIGNGFSQNIWRGFGYASLFDLAARDEGAHLNAEDISLFQALNTRNFELVLSALATSKVVSSALGLAHEHLDARETSIREALIRAVHGVHVPWASVPERHLDRISAEFAKYASIYCTNYDLLVYWSIMRDPRTFRDYFWAQQFEIANTEIRGKKTRVHFLHGGLHLYRQSNGQTLKRHAQADQNLLQLFGSPFHSATPLFISEGTSQEKLASIYRSDYLSFVFSRLVQDTEPLVIFGLSLGASDRHIVDAIGNHQGREIAVSIRAAENIRQRKAEIIEALPYAKIHFYDAATHPLGAPDLAIEMNDA